jgi:hypothetical protein
MCDAYGAYASQAKGSEGQLRLAHCFAHASIVTTRPFATAESAISLAVMCRCNRGHGDHAQFDRYYPFGFTSISASV